MIWFLKLKKRCEISAGSIIEQQAAKYKDKALILFEDRKIMPTKAITMGIGTIMKSKQIILLASGENKADIIQEMIYGKITPHIPASILQLHPDVIVIVDEIAGFKIRFDDKNA